MRVDFAGALAVAPACPTGICVECVRSCWQADRAWHRWHATRTTIGAPSRRSSPARRDASTAVPAGTSCAMTAERCSSASWRCAPHVTP
eukprot:2443315-Prymnesium_polylepis.1